MNAWEERAACRRPGKGDWLLPDGRKTKALTIANIEARRICRRACPVRAQCLEEALRTRDYGVIRGGVVLSEPMRWAVCHCGNRFLRPIRKTVRTCSHACALNLAAEPVTVA